MESHGTEYIDTGLKGQPGYDFSVKVNFYIQSGVSNSIGGIFQSGSSLYLGIIRSADSYLAFHYDGTDQIVKIQPVLSDIDYLIEGHMHVGNQSVTVNGNKTVIGNSTAQFISNKNIWLFAVNGDVTTPVFSHAKIYYLNVSIDGNVVRRLIPVMSLDDEPCMYDEVSGQFFYNQGTGEFDYWPKD